MEPTVLDALLAREPIFHHPELGDTRADFEAATVPDDWEVGASGRRYDREFIRTTLEQRQVGTGWQALYHQGTVIQEG